MAACGCLASFPLLLNEDNTPHGATMMVNKKAWGQRPPNGCEHNVTSPSASSCPRPQSEAELASPL